jgi:hypothetical protein
MLCSLQVFFLPKQSNILSSIVRTFMAACLLKRAKYLPSKWILHHDVAYFETELSIKLFFANGEASTILP